MHVCVRYQIFYCLKKYKVERSELVNILLLNLVHDDINMLWDWERKG